MKQEQTTINKIHRKKKVIYNYLCQVYLHILMELP